MGIVRPTMEFFPWAWTFFIPFIVITSFAVLNLFIGIIVDAMQTSQKEMRARSNSGEKKFTDSELQLLHDKLELLHQEIVNLKMTQDRTANGRE